MFTYIWIALAAATCAYILSEFCEIDIEIYQRDDLEHEQKPKKSKKK